MSFAGVRRAVPGDLPTWQAMRVALWPDADDSTEDLLAQLARTDAVVLVGLCTNGEPVGFAEASLRRDYVNGTHGSPVGFLEGLYVDPAWRRSGVGRALVEAVVQWTREQGCSELASDALLDNAGSHAAHAAYGFEETERVVYFRRAV